MDEISPVNNFAELEKRYRTTAFIYTAQIATAVVLTIVGYFIAGRTENPIAANSLMPLWVLILFLAVGTFLFRRILYKWERLKDLTLLKGADGLFKALQMNSIVLGSFAEAIAVIGFLIAELGGARADLVRAGIVALIVFLINFPRISLWRKIAASLEKV